MNMTANPVLPSESDILKHIEKKNGRYNGYQDLLDAFLAQIPDSAKEPKNDSHIERLYYQVKRAINPPTIPVYPESQFQVTWIPGSTGH